MARKHLNIGIFGFGCVGQGLYEALSRSGSVPATVKRICIKDPGKPRSLPHHFFTTKSSEILEDPTIDVVLELIDDPVAAYQIVTTALRKGKAVVSANKKMLADHFEDLIRLQAETGSPFLYEASCCASIPIIRNLEEYYDNDLLKGISGIFNGSSNYVLTQVFQQGWSYARALQEAQALGYAESDPSLDMDGWDSVYKLSILSAHAWGERIPVAQILRRGIAGIGEQEIRIARERGWQVKLIARAERTEAGYYAGVLPEFVSSDDPLAGVENEFNAVLLEGAFSEVQFFKGKGAGSLPTGSAVLSDLSALGYGYRYEYRKTLKSPPLQALDPVLKLYLRFHDPEVLAEIEFLSILESHRSLDFCYVIGEVRASELSLFLSRESSRDSFVARLPVALAEESGATLESKAQLALANS